MVIRCSNKKVKWLAAVGLLSVAISACGVKPLPANNGNEAVGQAHKKHTADSISFMVVGDWGQNGRKSQQTVANSMAHYAKQHAIQFVISTGDNFYPDGVTSIADQQWQTSFEKVYSAKSLQVPWYAVLGNHDYRTSPEAEVAYTAGSSRWHMPARNYVVRKKLNDTTSVLFAFLDTSPFVPGYYKRKMSDLQSQDTAAALQWMAQALATATDSWKIAIGHHPLYSTGRHGNTYELIERLQPLLQQSSTQFYLSGHDHSLQYNKVSGQHTHFLVSGGGSESTRVRKDAFTVFAQSSPGFLVVTLYPATARFYFYNANGKLLYTQQVTK